jgi:hypothetical protein
MHCRGDRTGGTDATLQVVLPSAQPDTGTFDEQAAFKKFNAAFTGLLGRDAPLTDAQMRSTGCSAPVRSASCTTRRRRGSSPTRRAAPR